MYRYRLLITALTLTALTILLTVASSLTTTTQAAPRSIPWDCSDWQESPAVADAEDARVSMILESLAANRGKAIYCAIDQSDTWTKAETWAAGRDRNERDDTVYFGQSGNFRGFLSAQEGYLTDGESGVTGVSRELIFEFPREERRRKKTIVTGRMEVEADAARIVESPWGDYGIGAPDQPIGYAQAENIFDNPNTRPNFPPLIVNAKSAARAYCRSEGYNRARKVALEPLVYVYSANTPIPSAPPQESHRYRAMQTHQWTATCEKTRRVRR